jgi:uncharacterized membrane protein
MGSDFGPIVLIVLFLIAIFIIFPIYVLITLAAHNRQLRELHLLLQQKQQTDYVSPAPQNIPVTTAPSAPAPATTAPPAPAAPPAPTLTVAPNVAHLLETRAAAVTPPIVQSTTPEPQVTVPTPPPVWQAPTAPPPPPPVAPAKPAREPRDFESVFGANWLSKLGVIAIAIAAVCFLQYALKNRWIGPTAQVAIGCIVACGLLGLGQYLLAKPIYRIYAQVLSSGGIIVLFVSIFAAFAYFQPPIISFPVAFAVLAVAALAASSLAARNNTQAVALLCLAGAFATPILIRQTGSGSSNLIQLYLYLIGLNILGAILARLRGWYSLTVLSFGATWLIFFGAGHLHNQNYLLTEAFAATFLVFTCYGGLATLTGRERTNTTETISKENVPVRNAWSVSLLLIGCALFTIASVMILADIDVFGLPAMTLAGVIIALLLCALAGLLLYFAPQVPALRLVFVYLSALCLVLIIGSTVAAAPATPHEHALPGFGFALFSYLVFLAVALTMRRIEKNDASALVLLGANTAAHLIVVFHVLANYHFFGINAALFWLPLAGWLTLLALWLLSRYTPDRENLRMMLMISAQVLALFAAFAALTMPVSWPKAQTLQILGIYFAQFLLISGTWLALRRCTRLSILRGDLLGAFTNAGVFFTFLAVIARFQAWQGFVLLCGCALVMAVYHVIIGSVVLRRKDDDLLVRLTYLGLALTFLTIAIPLQLRAGYITIAWAIESALLVWTGIAVNERRVRWYGYVLLGIAAGKALLLDIFRQPDKFVFLINPRMLAGAAVVIAAFICCSLLARRKDILAKGELPVAMAAAYVANLILLLFASYDLWDLLAHIWHAPLGRASAQQFALSVFWSAYAFVIILLGARKQNSVMRYSGLALLAIATAKVFFIDLFSSPAPFRLMLNTRLLAGVAAIIALYLYAWLVWKNRAITVRAEKHLAASGAVIASLLTLIFFSVDLWQSVGATGVRTTSAQQLTLSIFWLVYALGAISVGIWKRVKAIRLGAMGLLLVAILKVFCFDLSFLAQLHRIISFFGLGIILLLIAWLYIRFEERMKQPQTELSEETTKETA